MTPQEVKLWVRLRELRSIGYHFRRQAPVDQFIVDFACFDSRLVIEVDGGQHANESMLARDKKRDAHLISSGFNVIRFWNSDIDQNLEGVLETIEHLLRKPPPRPATPADPPRKGEG
jgi:very-short-patch-repair endonuclease